MRSLFLGTVLCEEVGVSTEVFGVVEKPSLALSAAEDAIATPPKARTKPKVIIRVRCVLVNFDDAVDMMRRDDIRTSVCLKKVEIFFAFQRVERLRKIQDGRRPAAASQNFCNGGAEFIPG
jgi:hypothetical protein